MFMPVIGAPVSATVGPSNSKSGWIFTGLPMIHIVPHVVFVLRCVPDPELDVRERALVDALPRGRGQGVARVELSREEDPGARFRSLATYGFHDGVRVLDPVADEHAKLVHVVGDVGDGDLEEAREYGRVDDDAVDAVVVTADACALMNRPRCVVAKRCHESAARDVLARLEDVEIAHMVGADFEEMR